MQSDPTRSKDAAGSYETRRHYPDKISDLTQLRLEYSSPSYTHHMQTNTKSQLPDHLKKLVRSHSKSQALKLYLESSVNPDPNIIGLLQKKPIRTSSGVTPVTVLTKPFPCPGECIFCPTDVRMPKSYIANEPGAQRAGQNGFDPYLQVYNRLDAYRQIGHPISKVELIILGGTWSVYPESYQIWFIKRLFDALNDFGSGNDNRPPTATINLKDRITSGETYNQHIAAKTNYLSGAGQASTWSNLLDSQKQNEMNACRCVGLVLETRPDNVTVHEVIRLRKLGATKIQIGIQSLSDEVLKLNKRGHTANQAEEAVSLLRQAGFKVHAHWMPNLYGSDPQKDIKDYQQLFINKNIRPDELKIYPCSLIDDTELVDFYRRKLWRPYTLEELTRVLGFVMTNTPEYCRLTRIIRDIPGTEIVAGNKTTNLRQLIEARIDKKNMHDIRSREIKQDKIDSSKIKLDTIMYDTTVSKEVFLQYVTTDRKIIAFLRLSLPTKPNFIKELEAKAIIREVHVYGQSVRVGEEADRQSQHKGLGKKLITQSINLAQDAGYKGIAVISAIGTREYYSKLGFTLGELYQHQDF
jgi:elongator complex protein 3